MRWTPLIALFASGCRESGIRLEYPPTRTVDVVEDHHGTRVSDPYRWLEDLESPEVREWAASQTAIALPLLRENNVRPWFLARLDKLGAFWSEAPAQGDPEQPLIDETALGDGNSLSDVWVSPDSVYAAYAVSSGGSEWVTTRIRRLADGQTLDDRIEGMLWSDASWTEDSRGFFYVRSVQPAPGERTAMKGPAVYYHVAGTPQSADVPVFRTSPDVDDIVVTQQLSGDGRYLFIYEGNGAHVDGIGWLLSRMYMLDLGDPKRPRFDGTVVALTPERDAAYRVIASYGDTLYVFTDRDAPRRRVVRIDVKDPSPERWKTIVPQTDDVIDQVYDIDGRFVVKYLRNVQHGMRVHERSGQLVRELSIPPLTVIQDQRAGSTRNELIIDARTGFAPTRTRHNLSTGAVTVERGAKLPFPDGEFEINQVWYPSKDGERIPMFLLHRRGIVLDGSHPTVMSGYGASSQLTLPYFDEFTIAILELDMILALPALRGGGEFGRSWYEAGIMERKQTTFDDFIAAAEFLISKGYTSPDKLAIEGSSNGGLLVTAVLNQRPELFRVAVAGVPQTDNLRYDRGRHITQFGDASDSAQFAFLYAYSPLHNIRPRTCYPSTLVTTALNDDRAPAWMALKYTAALQAAQSCNRPIVLRADTAGGHLGNWKEDAADIVAFIASQLGVKAPE